MDDRDKWVRFANEAAASGKLIGNARTIDALKASIPNVIADAGAPAAIFFHGIRLVKDDRVPDGHLWSRDPGEVVELLESEVVESLAIRIANAAERVE